MTQRQEHDGFHEEHRKPLLFQLCSSLCQAGHALCVRHRRPACCVFFLGCIICLQSSVASLYCFVWASFISASQEQISSRFRSDLISQREHLCMHPGLWLSPDRAVSCITAKTKHTHSSVILWWFPWRRAGVRAFTVSELRSAVWTKWAQGIIASVHASGPNVAVVLLLHYSAPSTWDTVGRLKSYIPKCCIYLGGKKDIYHPCIQSKM